MTNSIYEGAIKFVKIFGIPFTILVHVLAIYGMYIWVGIGVLSSIFILLTVLSMYNKLKRLITMSKRKADLLMEVEEKMKSNDTTNFKNNNDIWKSQS